MVEEFDDEKLQNLARYHLYTSSEPTYEQKEKVGTLIRKAKLDNSDRNFLLTFIDSNKKVKVKSMTEMKFEILEIIGATASSRYSNTMSRDDVAKIYEFMIENFRKGSK